MLSLLAHTSLFQGCKYCVLYTLNRVLLIQLICLKSIALWRDVAKEGKLMGYTDTSADVL